MPETAKLDDQLCFALYDASRTVASSYQAALTPLGLTYTQFLVLLVLWEADGISVTDLGDRMHLDSGTLSPVLKRLEGLGFVERRRERSDGRLVTVRLTTQGGALRTRAAELQQEMRAALPMSDDELAALHTLAQRFCNASRTPGTGTAPTYPPRRTT